MKIRCHRSSFLERVNQRGADLATAMACVSAVPGAHPDYIEVDTDHPAYPRAPAGTLPARKPCTTCGNKATVCANCHGPHPTSQCPIPSGVDDATAALRRVTCQSCEYGDQVGDYAGHCTKLCPRACARGIVNFKASPVFYCPLNGKGGWLA